METVQIVIDKDLLRAADQAERLGLPRRSIQVKDAPLRQRNSYNWLLR